MAKEQAGWRSDERLVKRSDQINLGRLQETGKAQSGERERKRKTYDHLPALP
jgi:hypothetical protein